MGRQNSNNVSRCSKCGRLVGVAVHQCPQQAWNKGLIGIYGGWKLSDETRARMRASNPHYWKGKTGAWKGKTRSEENKAKLRKPKTEEHKAKLRRPKSSEWVANWRAARVRNGSFANSDEQKLRHSQRMTGAANPNWKGGLSFVPYPTTWTPALRRQVRLRDNHTCQICGVLKQARNLEVHHIDYDKKNCTTSNLITLCIHCHRKTNFSRESWQQTLTEKMNESIDRDPHVSSPRQVA